MQLLAADWLEILRGEYVRDFILPGGSSVKFIVPLNGQELVADLRRCAEGLFFAFVDSATTKTHLIEKVFMEVARQVDWDGLALDFLTKIFLEKGYRLPEGEEPFNLRRIAALNDREEALLRRDVQSWLEHAICRDYEMSQDFRFAMLNLCLGRLEADELRPGLALAVKEWLKGELRLVSGVKAALIFSKVNRFNARHLLYSLVHWLRLNGRGGMMLGLDISRYTAPRGDEFLNYSGSAVIDGYEVLRQFIDGIDEVEGLLTVVLAAPEFLNDDRRGIHCYNALKARVLDEVADKRRQNPLASVVRLNQGEN